MALCWPVPHRKLLDMCVYVALGLTVGVLLSYITWTGPSAVKRDIVVPAGVGGDRAVVGLVEHTAFAPVSGTEDLTPSNRKRTRASLLTDEIYWRKLKERITGDGVYRESDDVPAILDVIRSTKVTSISVLSWGTSFKFSVVLSGGQRFIFKPQFPDSERYRLASCNTGYEQPRYEVAVFHIDRILNLRKTPYVAGRSLDILSEILPAADKEVKDLLTIHPNGTACVSFKCFYCDKANEFCYPDGHIPGAMIYYFTHDFGLYKGAKNWYHPFQPYGQENSVISNFNVNNDTMCRRVRGRAPYTNESIYMDLHDTTVLDYLTLHIDRKHNYLMSAPHSEHLLSVHIDHGLSFCPHIDRGLKYLISSLRLCCRMRRSTHERLIRLQDAGPRFAALFHNHTSADDLFPILTSAQVGGVLNRVEYVLRIVSQCQTLKHNVIVDV